MRLESLRIRYSSFSTPGHYDGTIEYEDEVGGSKIELKLRPEQLEGLFPVVADALIEVSRQAAEVLRSAIIQEKEKEI